MALRQSLVGWAVCGHADDELWGAATHDRCHIAAYVGLLLDKTRQPPEAERADDVALVVVVVFVRAVSGYGLLLSLGAEQLHRGAQFVLGSVAPERQVVDDRPQNRVLVVLVVDD